MTKPSKADGGYCEMEQEAVEALRAAWATERVWRAEMRTQTAYHDAGMADWVAMVAWEGYERPANVEVRGLLSFAQRLSLNEIKVREIYQAVTQETEPSEASRDERLSRCGREFSRGGLVRDTQAH